MKKIISYLYILLLAIPNIVFAQQDSAIAFGDEEIPIEYYFGFNLQPNAMGGLYHVAIVKPEKDGTYKIRQITKENFIAQAKGQQYSLANPKGIDMFKKFQIENPNIIDDLWRLRYQEYPYETRQTIDKGWSSNDSIPVLPSPTQMKTLEKFGMFKMSDYIIGDNAFRLLQMMGKPEWVNLYKEKI